MRINICPLILENKAANRYTGHTVTHCHGLQLNPWAESVEPASHNLYLLQCLTKWRKAVKRKCRVTAHFWEFSANTLAGLPKAPSWKGALGEKMLFLKNTGQLPAWGCQRAGIRQAITETSRTILLLRVTLNQISQGARDTQTFLNYAAWERERTKTHEWQSRH